MSSRNQISTLYAQLGIEGIPVIAEGLRMSEGEIRAYLYENEPSFRTAVARGDGNPADSKDVADEMLEIITALARHSMSDNVKLAAATTVRDELLGRNDVKEDKSHEVPDALRERMTKCRDSVRLKLA